VEPNALLSISAPHKFTGFTHGLQVHDCDPTIIASQGMISSNHDALLSARTTTLTQLEIDPMDAPLVMGGEQEQIDLTG
jgi:hypothetical protein